MITPIGYAETNTMQEYDTSSAQLYDYYSTGLEGDVEFYVDQARKTGGPVLELACGTGRVLIPVAEAGVEIVGLDQSSAMLNVARQKLSECSPEVQKRIEIVDGDMRDFSLGRRFGLITIPYRSFLHLLTVDDQKRTLQRIHEHLADDGLFVFNIFDPNMQMIVEHSGSLGSTTKKQGEFTHPETGRRIIVLDTRQYDTERQMIDEYFIFEELDDDGTVVSKRYSHMTLRYVFRYEMEHLLELCGFHVEALHGDFTGGPFRSGGEQIWITRRA